jgi:hypothetical protein
MLLLTILFYIIANIADVIILLSIFFLLDTFCFQFRINKIKYPLNFYFFYSKISFLINNTKLSISILEKVIYFSVISNKELQAYINQVTIYNIPILMSIENVF